MTMLARLATYAASRDTTRGIARTAKEHLMVGRLTARDRANGMTKCKGGGKGSGKVNSVSEERCEGDPHADSTAVSAVTQDDHWIMMLEREARQADLSKETGFEVCADTLRTAIGTL